MAPILTKLWEVSTRPLAWSLQARWKANLVGAVFFGGPIAIVLILMFHYYVHPQPPWWFYLLIVVIAALSGVGFSATVWSVSRKPPES